MHITDTQKRFLIHIILVASDFTKIKAGTVGRSD